MKILVQSYHRRLTTVPAQIRIAISSAGDMTIESFATPPVPSQCLFPMSLSRDPDPATHLWSSTLADHPITPSFYTQHKTNRRSHYDDARAARQTADASAETLVRNTEGELMEGCLTTPYLWRDGGWVTPRVKAGGNRGTTRKWALFNNYATEGEILIDELVDGEMVWLSNGVHGVC